MKALSKVLVLLAMALFVGVAQAEEKAEKKPAGLKGEVVRVDGTNLIVKAKDQEVTVATDSSTEVIINGAAAKLSDLKAGDRVMITPAEGTAKRIQVAPTKTKGEGEKKAKTEKAGA